MKIFHLPDLGEGLADAEIRAWLVKVGDSVVADQPMVSVETAKAVVEVPAPFAGRIVRLYGQPGERINTHAPLVEFATDQGSVVGVLEEGDTLLDEQDNVTTVVASKTASGIKVMPAVRALARELGVDLLKVSPRGPSGQITADDVRQAAGQAGREQGEPLHGTRRSMAEIMIRSGREVVPATVMDQADVTGSPEDFTVWLIQAISKAVAAEPALNATFHGETMSRTVHAGLNLGLAMDSPEGLFVPVLKNVGKQTAKELRDNINRLKQGVRERTLTPVEMQGATFILSNFGTIAGRYANPVVVPPMVAILGCGKIHEAVVVHEGKMAIRKIAPLSLSFDHRAVTGGEASRFLAAVIHALEGRHT